MKRRAEYILEYNGRVVLLKMSVVMKPYILVVCEKHILWRCVCA